METARISLHLIGPRGFEVALIGRASIPQPQMIVKRETPFLATLSPCLATRPLTIRARMTTHASTSKLESRFSFNDQGEPLPGIYEATPMEMAAQFAAISRTQVRRRSYEMAAPECRIDRNLATRILVKAGVMERESYKRRARYEHRGVLGDLSIALLVVLMNFGRKYGRIFPDYDTLAAMLRKGSAETVIEAMKRLIDCGFVTKHRRSKLIGTPQGKRRVQDSNAYEVHMPDAGLAIVPLVANKTGSNATRFSGSDNSGVSDIQIIIPNENIDRRPKKSGFG
jgi:hypothetical protein